MYDVASSTARVSAFAFSARARSSAATASMAGEIRARSVFVSAPVTGRRAAPAPDRASAPAGRPRCPGTLRFRSAASRRPRPPRRVRARPPRRCGCLPESGRTRAATPGGDVGLVDLHDLVDARLVLGLVGEEVRRHPDPHDLQRERRSDDLAAEAEHVRVGVRAREPGAERVLADRRVTRPAACWRSSRCRSPSDAQVSFDGDGDRFDVGALLD